MILQPPFGYRPPGFVSTHDANLWDKTEDTPTQAPHPLEWNSNLREWTSTTTAEVVRFTDHAPSTGQQQQGGSPSGRILYHRSRQLS